MIASPERGDSPRGGEMPVGQRGPLSTRGTSEAGGGILMKFFLELQISQQNPSVSLRLPAPFSREPNLIYKIIKITIY